MNEEFLHQAEAFVEKTFTEQLSERITYHNMVHTRFVVDNSLKLAEMSGLSEKDTYLLNIAALFHDLGYIEVEVGHELKSAALAEQYLNENGWKATDILAVKQLILATQMHVQPESLSEKIIRDADVAHLGSEIYFEKSELLKTEWEKVEGKKIERKDWLMKNAEFFHSHDYYTKAGKELYNGQKQQNLDAILKRISEIDEASFDKPKKKKKKKDKGGNGKVQKRPDRGIETMFRVTLKNHIQLSQIADNKANIMLSINAIIISIVLTSLFPKLDKHTYLIWPSVMLLVVCIASIVLATISTIPKVTKVRTDRESIESKSANLLFFGNFHDMDYPDFNWGMNQLMDSEDYLYNSMIKDLYYLGKVLFKKYKYLRLCYAVFMVGIIITVLFYLISTTIAFQHPETL